MTSISIPPTFNFKRTVMSHGWCELPPFEIDTKRWLLHRTLDLKGSQPVTVTVKAARGKLLINTSRELGKKAQQQAIRDVRHMFRMDEDLTAFYATMSSDPRFEWIADTGAGRLLRSPTVFEDLVKMICTTNCSWSLTQKMVSGLVQNLGRPAEDGRKTFPTPQEMSAMPLSFYVSEVRAGYRAPYLKELADRAASDSLFLEDWLTSKLSTVELMKKLLEVKGVGPYAAENLLKLLGRYDGLALDSWTRAQFFRVRNNGRKVSDKKIASFYARFKEWRGLALWCDVTRDWLE